jgi:ketosteroid isomerase-like protein
MAAFEDLVKKWTVAFNQHDARAVAAYYAKDCVAHDPFYPEPLKGPSGDREGRCELLPRVPRCRGRSHQHLREG